MRIWQEALWMTAVLGLLAPAAFAAHAPAQGVLLEIRPPVGDTLRMKMDQTFEMTEDSAGAQPMSATVELCTHSVVRRRTSSGTELQSVTDSIDILPASMALMPIFADTRRELLGRTVGLRIATDGAITVLDNTHSVADLSEVTMQMPPLLPERPVQVGAIWTRDMRIPINAAGSSTEKVHATFRLDSLGPDNGVAFISMKGTFSHVAGKEKAALVGAINGTLSGTMQVDRRLEWMTDSRTTITLASTIHLASGTAATHVHTKITQWLREVPSQ